MRAVLRGHRGPGGRPASTSSTRDIGRAVACLRVDGGLTRSPRPHAGAGRPRCRCRSTSTRRRTRPRSGAAALARLALRPGRAPRGRRRGPGSRRRRYEPSGRPTGRLTRWPVARGGRSRPLGDGARHDRAVDRGRRRRWSSAAASSAAPSRASCARLSTSSVALVEARGDVGDATSKANTAILHTGFDAVPGIARVAARRARLRAALGVRRCVRASRSSAPAPCSSPGPTRSSRRCRRCATRPCQRLRARASSSTPTRSTRCCRTSAPGALGGLTVPDESIICPWTTTLAFATEAVARGVQLLLRHAGGGRRSRGPSRPPWSPDRGRIADPLGRQRRGARRRRARPAARATTASPSCRAAAS